MNFGPDRLPYDVLGGAERVDALAKAFYGEMARNPAFKRLRELHPENLDDSQEKFRLFLSGWLGGPDLYVQKHGHPRLRMRHAPFPIGQVERDQWLACMRVALNQLEVDGDIREFLDARFAHVADFMRNQPG